MSCVLRDGRALVERDLLSMRAFLSATKIAPHPEEHREAVRLEGRTISVQSGAFCA
jgi:hypothetical protein